MGLKSIISNLGEKNRARKELMKEVENQVRVQEIIENRKKSANERELERFIDEEREERIKYRLNFERKKRENDIRFGHNPLNTPNITKNTDWEILKSQNLFKKQKNMFFGQKSILNNEMRFMK